MIAVSIPAAEPQAAAGSPDKAHTVFRVEVLCNGRRHTVAKRYSEFQALHKRIKKTCKVPDFPPRRVPNWMPKVLEQRRQGLELYIQGVLYHNEELPQDVLDFLKVRRGQQDPKAGSPPTGPPPSQRPVIGFSTDPYVRPPGTDLLPNTVLRGVLLGLYIPLSCTPSQAAPRAPGPCTPTQRRSGGRSGSRKECGSKNTSSPLGWGRRRQGGTAGARAAPSPPSQVPSLGGQELCLLP